MTEISGKSTIRKNYNLSHLTWFKVGGDADIFFKPYNATDLALFLKENNQKLPITVIGAGSNIIIRDGGIEGVTIKLGRNFTDIEFVNDNLISVGAGCLNFSLAKFCQANSIGGFEFLIGIPGTIGGGVAMNAGAYGREFKDIVNSVQAMNTSGKILTLTLSDIGFGYRSNKLPQDLIFTKVFFNIQQNSTPSQIKHKMEQINAQRNSTQPIREKTGGSTFANPPNLKSWKLIDEAGMRGFKLGGACISKLHCNFMINVDNAVASDIENLGELVIKKVKETSSVELKWEIKRLGRISKQLNK